MCSQALFPPAMPSLRPSLGGLPVTVSKGRVAARHTHWNPPATASTAHHHPLAGSRLALVRHISPCQYFGFVSCLEVKRSHHPRPIESSAAALERRDRYVSGLVTSEKLGSAGGTLGATGPYGDREAGTAEVWRKGGEVAV